LTRSSRALVRSRLLLLAAAPVMAIGACYTVDLGNPPADINACRPSQSYFAGNPGDAGPYGGIWQNLLDKDYGGKKCHDSTCHGAGANNALRLTPPPGCIPSAADPACVIPIPLTLEWADNYRVAAEQMNCSNVAASRLYTLPSGLAPAHGGGKLFEPTGSPEADLIIGWVGAAP
jgi:hypothetical protein